jgi:3-methylcrotonyl-CoA carboxylase beta subunit
MSITSFSFPTPIRFGAGARKLVAAHLQEQGFKRPLIVTDRALGALPVLAEFRRKQSAWWSTSEIWDDGVIDPVDTRNALGIGLSASLNAPIGEPRYGVFRM